MPAAAKRPVEIDEELVRVGNRTLTLSHLDKVLYPTGFTKAEVINYYRAVAPVLLPHLKGRPLTMRRFPHGVRGESFYEKSCPSFRPRWVRTIRVSTEQRAAGYLNYCTVDDLPSLIWVANLAALELHTYLSRRGSQGQPTMVVFDLDPGAPANIRDCARVALVLQKLFGRLNLEAYPKTSGGKGLQLYLPLNTPTTFTVTKRFAHAVARTLEQQTDGVVSTMGKKQRRGQVLIDWSQNSRHKSTVSVYSLRAQSAPTVSTPVTWDEVARAARSRAAKSPLSFTAQDLLARIRQHGDLFGPVLTRKQRLPK
jgi:bifunctional non-homologous end joining protein LigD